jgi:hypothetical protein
LWIIILYKGWLILNYYRVWFLQKTNHKYKVYRESKFTKMYFNLLKKNSEPLDLIHLDIDDLKFMQTKVDKRCYIIFIDNCIRFCYTYFSLSQYTDLEMIKKIYGSWNI